MVSIGWILCSLLVALLVSSAHSQRENRAFTNACEGKARLTVTSDVDDTFKAPDRLHRANGFLAGDDKSWTWNSLSNSVVYPGMGAFQVALARGPNGNRTTTPVTLLSARPEELADYGLAITNDGPIAESLKAAGGPGIGEAKYGSIKDNIYATRSGRFAAYARAKAIDLSELRAADSDACFASQVAFCTLRARNVGASPLLTPLLAAAAGLCRRQRTGRRRRGARDDRARRRGGRRRFYPQSNGQPRARRGHRRGGRAAAPL